MQGNYTLNGLGIIQKMLLEKANMQLYNKDSNGKN